VPEFQGSTEVVLTGHDGGRAAERRFDVYVGTSAIYGAKYEDFNANGQQDPGEPGVEGWTIGVDLDQNGVVDPDEPVTVTDRFGRYRFVGLEPETPGGPLVHPAVNVFETGQDAWAKTTHGLGITQITDNLGGSSSPQHLHGPGSGRRSGRRHLHVRPDDTYGQ
jgi:hypothetical protein